MRSQLTTGDAQKTILRYSLCAGDCADLFNGKNLYSCKSKILAKKHSAIFRAWGQKDNTMQEKKSQFVSQRQAAAMCGMTIQTFQRSYAAHFFPFRMYALSAFRNGFKRADVEAFVEAQEQRVVDLPAGESITAVRVE